MRNPAAYILTAAFIIMSLSLTAYAAPEKDAYVQNAEFLIENGVQFYNGKKTFLFSQYAPVTRAEYIKYLVQAMKCPIVTESNYDDADKHPYKIYIATAYAHNFIPQSHFGSKISPDAKLTKNDAAIMTANALKLEAYESEPYYADYSGGYVNALINSYVIFGEYADGKESDFYPEKIITYGDAADLLVRAIKYAEFPTEYRSGAVIERAKTVPVASEWRMYDLLWAISSRRIEKAEFYLDMENSVIAEVFSDLTIRKPELNIMSVVVLNAKTPEQESIIEFSYIPLTVTPEEDIALTYDMARNIAAGLIKDSMTDKEKLYALYDYLIKNCAYDYGAGKDVKLNSASSAFNVFYTRKAVCQGISAAFNILSEAVGIKSYSVSGTPPNSVENHMWNAVLIGGEIFFCDATWDINDTMKSNKKIKYFMKTEKEIKELGYKFNSDKVKMEYFYK